MFCFVFFYKLRFFLSLVCCARWVCHVSVRKVDRRYDQSFDRLQAEMNSYKNNLIKESIRMGYNELGDLSYRR